MHICIECGEETPDGIFCSSCGASLSSTKKPASTPESKMTPEQKEPQRSAAAYGAPLNVGTNSDLTTPFDETDFESSSHLEIAPVVNEAPIYAAIIEDAPQKNGFKAAFFTLSIIALCLVLSIFFAFETAETKTYRGAREGAEPTGVFHVTDDHEPPCYLNQNWYACIEEHVDEYNAACVNRNLDSSSKVLCENYRRSIENMKSDGAANEWS